MNVLELFSGSGTVSKAFEERGHTVFSVDIRRRKGVCEPTLRKDVLLLEVSDLPFKPNVIWASPPCTTFSHATGNLYWQGGQFVGEKALKSIELLKKSLVLIELCRPDYYFIENPRGHMRKYPELLAFLKRTQGETKTITLSSYGFPTTKPTNIFTNAIDWVPRPLAPFGRGAKVPVNFSNMTVCKRQATPRELANELVDYCEKKLGGSLD